MNIKTRHTFFLLIAALLILTSCQQVVVQVDDIPSNTPKDQPIYITGNFNNWDPGEERYRLELNADSSYTIQLPPGFCCVG